jgi:hypothetical protein
MVLTMHVVYLSAEAPTNFVCAAIASKIYVRYGTGRREQARCNEYKLDPQLINFVGGCPLPPWI